MVEEDEEEDERRRNEKGLKEKAEATEAEATEAEDWAGERAERQRGRCTAQRFVWREIVKGPAGVEVLGSLGLWTGTGAGAERWSYATSGGVGLARDWPRGPGQTGSGKSRLGRLTAVKRSVFRSSVLTVSGPGSWVRPHRPRQCFSAARAPTASNTTCRGAPGASGDPPRVLT